MLLFMRKTARHKPTGRATIGTDLCRRAYLHPWRHILSHKDTKSLGTHAPIRHGEACNNNSVLPTSLFTSHFAHLWSAFIRVSHAHKISAWFDESPVSRDWFRKEPRNFRRHASGIWWPGVVTKSGNNCHGRTDSVDRHQYSART